MPILDARGNPIRPTFTKAEYARDKAILKGLAKTSCPKCRGRGFVGKNIHTGKLLVCKCVNIPTLIKTLKLYKQIATKRIANA